MKFLFVLSIIFYFSLSIFGQQQPTAIDSLSNGNQSKWTFLDNTHTARLNLPFSINPDFPCLRLGRSGEKWKNMIGQTFGIAKVETPNFTISSVLSAFIELHDIHPNEFMSWQLWRGNLGFDFYLENKNINKRLGINSQIVFQLGYHHESQHATDVIGYAWKYLKPINYNNFPNGTVRSFEYFNSQFHYINTINNWILSFSPGYKMYPYTLLNINKRDLLHAFQLEIGIQRKISKLWSVYLNGYYEAIENNFQTNNNRYSFDFESIAKDNWNKEAFLYRNIELGMLFTYKQKQGTVFFNYSNSNGRGLDVLRMFSEFGMGFRFIL